MYLASVLIALSTTIWSGYLYAARGDRQYLLLGGWSGLLLVVDVWVWAVLEPTTASGLLIFLLTAYSAAVVAWSAGLVRHFEEIGERHKKELGEALYESEAMRRLKAAFLANMNHEIRTPLTSIIGFSSLLVPEVAPDHRNMMRVIERSGQRLLDTLDSFLDLAMLESGRVQLTHELVDLAEEARFHASRYGALARGKGLSLHVAARSGAVYAGVDRSCLGRIFSRLISNAIKFTEEGSITIDVQAANGCCYVSIRDTGIGIDQEYLPCLFDEFTQASTGTGRAFEGSGLGLAVTKRLVELLDGTIDVKTAPFEGSTFTVMLPAAGGGAVHPDHPGRAHASAVPTPAFR